MPWTGMDLSGKEWREVGNGQRKDGREWQTTGATVYNRTEVAGHELLAGRGGHLQKGYWILGKRVHPSPSDL